MTVPTGGSASDRSAPDGSASDGSKSRGDDGDPEAVLSQALRAMAGGGRVSSESGSDQDAVSSPGVSAGASPAQPASQSDDQQRYLTTAQVLLIASIIGSIVGIGAALIVLLVIR